MILTYRVLEKKSERPSIVVRSPLPVRMLWNMFYWTFERATWQYDGTVRMPIQETFWATRFGMLTDRFGTPWMINCEKAVA